MSEKHNCGMNTRLFEHCRAFAAPEYRPSRCVPVPWLDAIWPLGKMLRPRRRACLILVAFAALTEPPARSAAYLPLVGPPPMRFEKATDGSTKISWTPPALIPPAVVVEPTPQNVTPTIPVNNVVSPHSVVEPAKTPVPLPTENLSTNSTVQAKSANELLLVTPEMLVDYFKPNHNATNAANVRVLAPVNFTPPASASMPSSQASYISP
jgi:hypothetical protein